MSVLSLDGENFAGLTSEILRRGGIVRFRARGASMQPFIKDGDIVEVRPLHKKSIRLGDVVLLKSDKAQILIHRIVRVTRTDRTKTFISKGDALFTTDGIIAEDQILGCVVALKRENRDIMLSGAYKRFLGLCWKQVKCAHQVIKSILASKNSFRH